MHEITYFSGRPWTRDDGFQYPNRSAQSWLKKQTRSSVTRENIFYINECFEPTCTNPQELRPMALDYNADSFAHHAFSKGDGWQLKNMYSWTKLEPGRYKLWQVSIAFIEDDTLAVQFKLAAPWENEYEQD